MTYDLYSDVIMSAMASRLFAEPFIQAQIKENIKAPRHWLSPLVNGAFLSQRASNAENVPFYDVFHITGPL